MYATDAFRSEHRVIEQVLGRLEKIAEQCALDGSLDIHSARQAIDFFQNFADRCHHCWRCAVSYASKDRLESCFTSTIRDGDTFERC